MATARFKKSGGGFLNGVSGALVSLKFNSKTWDEGAKPYTTLDAELEILQDGAEEAVKQFLPAGFLYDGQQVSDDQTTVVDDDGNTLDDGVVRGDTDFARFVQSAVEGGFDENGFDADPNNYQCLAGRRYTFGKELNRDRQMAAGKKKLGKAKAAAASEEEIMLAGRRQDKNDKSKFYNHDRLIVTADLGEAETAPKGKGGNAAAKPAGKPAGKPAKGSKAAKEGVTAEQAEEMLLDLLADAKNNESSKAGLGSLMTRKAIADDIEDDVRDEYREFFADEDFLAREAGWTFDADSKAGTVALAKKGKKR